MTKLFSNSWCVTSIPFLVLGVALQAPQFLLLGLAMVAIGLPVSRK